MTFIAIGLGLVCVYLAIRLHYSKEAGYQQYCEVKRLHVELLVALGRIEELESLEVTDHQSRRAGVLH